MYHKQVKNLEEKKHRGIIKKNKNNKNNKILRYLLLQRC
jgi:hypothetical protein